MESEIEKAQASEFCDFSRIGSLMNRLVLLERDFLTFLRYENMKMLEIHSDTMKIVSHSRDCLMARKMHGRHNLKPFRR